ncbi:MAG: putative LPS assembly protein LptD, partial [Gemmatimonadaceae bacterium]
LMPMPKDTSKDTLNTVKWPTPDSLTLSLLNKRGYSITRYQADTAYFINSDQRVLDLLAAGKRRAIVDRDSQLVVSDSGIYYSQATRHVATGGHYVLSSPGSGQADIRGIGRVDYDLAEKSVRVTRAHLPVNNGQIWYLDVALAQVMADTTNAKSSTIWIKGGSLTSCDDSIPDFRFVYHEAKRMGNMLAARPAIMYVEDVPVLWLPFIFTDTRPGRHSGILAPQFGIGDIVRNSPTYRRNVDHVGYYWAIDDYMDLAGWLDWRSSAGATAGDPGWLRLNGDWQYKWIDRFMAGRVGVSYTTQRDGSTNTAITWTHGQEFSHDSRLNLSANYVTNTTLQRQNTFNPYSALATIASQASYQTKFGPASVTLGASRKQYPGREQVDQTFPTLTLSSTPITLGSWLSWTPGFSFNRSDVLNMDQPGVGAITYSLDPVTGLRDSSQTKGRSSATTSMSFDTPITLFGYNLRNSFRVNQQRNNFPQQVSIYDLESGQVSDTRIFAATYRTDVDWAPDFTLPPFARNRFNLSPSLSFANVDPGPFWVETERSNGHFVHQSKRFTFGVSASPTLFGLFNGFGPFSRFRHSITPTIGYSYAPEAKVSDDYLLALGRTRFGYLGSLRQNALNFGLTQNIEAKIKPKNDTTGNAQGQPLRLLTLNMTSLTYDFERAHLPGHTWKNGLTTEQWGYNLSSDLLPGFDFSTSYSLFQGSTLSDTAKFKPYLTSVSATMNIGRDQNPIAFLTRLFGLAQPAAQASPTPPPQPGLAGPEAPAVAQVAAQPVAGMSQAGDRFIVPPTNGWKASFSFSRASPRPPVGTNVIDFDPRARCQQVAGTNQFLLDACLAQQRVQPTVDTPVGSTIIGGPAYNIQPTTSINSNISFNLTQKWAASWQTTYDVEHHEFASHIVSLQRDLHDARAIFGFTQSPNGNFAFHFMIALKAEPDIKFDYNKATVRSGISPF